MKKTETIKVLVGLFLFLGAVCPFKQQQLLFAQSLSPVLFQPGVINTGDYESHPAFSPTGETLYFLKCTPDINNSCTICISFLKNGKWTEPMVAPFSGHYYDIDPFITADGKTLYFCSNRPLQKEEAPKQDTDIWRVSIAGNGWGEPEHISGGMVNSTHDEYYPTLSDNGNLYFGSTRNGKSSDIFVSKLIKGKFQEPENLGDSINTDDNEYEPFIAPDESFVVFMAAIPRGLNNADFYLSYNRQGKWSKAIKLPEPVNSPFTEWSPKITRDKKYFFFSSTRSIVTPNNKSTKIKELQEKLNSVGNGLGDIYYLDAAFLKQISIN